LDLAAGRRLWDADTARFIAALFDQLAAEWDSTRATGRDDPLRDALKRGGLLPDGTCLELGSGTGSYTALLQHAFPRVVRVYLSPRVAGATPPEQMCRRPADPPPSGVRAEPSALPLADGQVVAVAAIDMLLFPAETARVLAPGDALLWINQLGEDGPLYLPAA